MKRFYFLAMISLVGCVSMRRYNDLQSQYDAQTEKTTDLQKQLDDAKTSNQDLSQSQTALEDEKSSLQADKSILIASGAEKEKQYDDVVNQLQSEVSAGKLKITRYQNMLTLNVAEEILFDSGKAKIKPNGKKILEKVGKALAMNDKMIRVVGNTDNQPLPKGAPYSTNWELSTARATKVVRFLQEECKIDPKRLISEGRGEYAPMEPNTSKENRHKNRRIEIILINKDVLEGIKLKDVESEPVTKASEVKP